MLFSILSFLPIAVLLVVCITKGVKIGISFGLGATIILFFVWDSQILAFPAAVVAAFIDTISILMIVFGALLLHQSMDQAGFITKIKFTLSQVHRDVGFQFFFLAFFMTAFFESVAGFGTPGAIVPLLLVSLGFTPTTSIVVVLLIDGLFALTGAVGTPVIAGLERTLSLNPSEVSFIYFYASIFVIISGVSIVFFVKRFVAKEQGEKYGQVWKLYMAIGLPFVGLSFFIRELTGIVASAIMGILSYLFLFTNKKLDFKPWFPYIFLLLLLLLPKMIPSLASLISLDLALKQIFGSSVSVSFKPLGSPMFPFLFASGLALVLSGTKQLNLSPVTKKVFGVFLVLFPSLAITRLMLASGTEMPSMVETMSNLFTEAGVFYPFISPFIGVLGTFITGSTTVSNFIFGPVQYNAAANLSLPIDIVLAMQVSGASIGNAICLFNIIAASAVAGVSDYSSILRKNIIPVFIAASLIALCGTILLLVS